jgi:DNA-binding beta-propeller fold protein YncE
MVRAAETTQLSGGRAVTAPQPRLDLLAAVALAVAVVLAGLAAVLLSQDVPGRTVAAQAYPSRLIRQMSPPSDVQSSPAGWNQPSDVVMAGGRWFVLDTGNNRILEVDEEGATLRVLDKQRDARLALRGPMAIESDGQFLYVANSGAGEVLVLTPDGELVRTVAIQNAAGGALPPRPIGLAVASDGGLVVSDAANHRVMRYDREGLLVWTAGDGGRASGKDGFNTPAGVALDSAGHVYVVDILNGRVVKLAPDGTFLTQYGRLGDAGGMLARPKDVATDAAGNVYVSDGLLASVHVFGSAGEYRGFIGLKDPGDRDSGALFRAPAGLTIDGSSLYVVDRFGGVSVLELPGGE